MWNDDSVMTYTDRLSEIVIDRTGKKPGPHIDTGYFVITEVQAKLLCNGKLPRNGCEMWFWADGKPSNESKCDYIIVKTPVRARANMKNGDKWSIRLHRSVGL